MCTAAVLVATGLHYLAADIRPHLNSSLCAVNVANDFVYHTVSFFLSEKYCETEGSKIYGQIFRTIKNTMLP